MIHRLHLGSGGDVPNSNSRVRRTGHDLSSAHDVTERRDGSAVSGDFLDDHFGLSGFTSSDIPDANFIVVMSSHDELAVSAEAQRLDRGRRFELSHHLAIVDLPNADGR